MRSFRQHPLPVLGLVAAAAAVLLAGVHQWTAGPIAEQAEQRAHATLTQLLAEGSYDNDPIHDRFPAWIAGLEPPSTIHRARRAGEPIALLADVTTTEGYSGPIRLLIALRPDGEVIGVRVLEHRETPGLGDRIESDRSDWIRQFEGRALGDPPAGDWRPDRRGGAFDTLSSATITSAAVIDAIGRVLAWQRANRERIFEIPASQE
ncbi:RnfABCDGE type electron transport complex subunit G [Wenzhouxiangella sp. XN79A]|uniref:RnfABCDGE type electron transport complex subunit G n=1 Tax=Wenzhouxiangella sp. XN79A TaxID=2724193 RepID=UPI00144A5EA2|nr:RnfABCDGE type electron transport complex subunit G [Wenzhouxiangella sp. XN79A]NKI35415.1 RnfABCDGE type electron transport complex subunit G [Wenzhouxiangella sp. XN79A]